MTWIVGICAVLIAAAAAVRAWLHKKSVDRVTEQINHAWDEAQKRINALPDPDKPLTKKEVRNEVENIIARGRGE